MSRGCLFYLFNFVVIIGLLFAFVSPRIQVVSFAHESTEHRDHEHDFQVNVSDIKFASVSLVYRHTPVEALTKFHSHEACFCCEGRLQGIFRPPIS